MAKHFDELRKSLSSDSERILTNLLSSPAYSSDFFKMDGERPSQPVRRVGETVRIACLDIGSYRPEDMVWQVEDEHVLVQGKRAQRVDKGVEGAKFSRAIPIPDGVDPKRISTRFNDIDGQYIIEGVKFEKEQRTPKRKTSCEVFNEAKMTLTIDLGNSRAQKLVHNDLSMNHLIGNRRVFDPETDKIVI